MSQNRWHIPFSGTIGIGPVDLDGDRIPEIVDPGWICFPDGPNRTERAWKLKGDGYSRWQLRHFKEDELSSVESWSGGGK